VAILIFHSIFLIFHNYLFPTFLHMNGSMKEPNMFHNYVTEKITRKASDVAENLQLK